MALEFILQLLNIKKRELSSIADTTRFWIVISHVELSRLELQDIYLPIRKLLKAIR